MVATSPSLGLELLPSPKPDEIMTVLFEELKVSTVVELLWSLRTVQSGTHAVMEVVPDM